MEAFFDFFNSGNLLSIFIKLFGIVLGIMYILFSVVMIKQISSMKEAVNVSDQGVLHLAALLQLGFALLVVFYALFVL
jgi:hypothetical protein